MSPRNTSKQHYTRLQEKYRGTLYITKARLSLLSLILHIVSGILSSMTTRCHKMTACGLTRLEFSGTLGIECGIVLLRHGRDIHPMWVKLFTETLRSGFLRFCSTRAKSKEDFDSY